MKLKIYQLIFLAFFIFSCQKNATQKNNVFISENEFIGTKEQFEEYKKLFLKQNEFPSYMSEENYVGYVEMVNSKEFQKQYFEMKNEKWDMNKPRIIE